MMLEARWQESWNYTLKFYARSSRPKDIMNHQDSRLEVVSGIASALGRTITKRRTTGVDIQRCTEVLELNLAGIDLAGELAYCPET